jgi:hypothetical protein
MMDTTEKLIVNLHDMTPAEVDAVKRILLLLEHPANDKVYTHMVGEDGSCYGRIGEATPVQMLEKMPGLCLLLLDQPDIVEVSVKRPLPGHPTNGVHFVEDVIKLRSNENG